MPFLGKRGKAPHDEFLVFFTGFASENNQWVTRDQLHAVELLDH
jgi:hypothetical protein